MSEESRENIAFEEIKDKSMSEVLEESKTEETINVTVNAEGAEVKEASSQQKKKKKRPEYKSNEYSVLRYIIYLILGFGGGQVIGGALAGLIVMIIPAFGPNGSFYGMSYSASIIIAFVFSFLLAVLLMKPILNTTYKSLVTGNRPYKIGWGLSCAVLYIIVMGVVMLITRDNISYYPVEKEMRIFSIIFVVLLVPFQTTTEEIFFRMTLGRLFMKNEVMKSMPKILLASLISGLIFFVPHLSNPEVRAYGILAAIICYFGVGFALMFICCLIGSFEGAIAVHAINNIWGMCIASSEVSAASFAPFFIDKTDSTLTICLTQIVLYGCIILWTVIYKKKFMAPKQA